MKPLSRVWAVDGSFVPVATQEKPPREVAFVKAALIVVDRAKLDAIDKLYPHPLQLRDMMAGCGFYHATAFPLKNIRTPLGTNYDAVRHIVRDSKAQGRPVHIIGQEKTGTFADHLASIVRFAPPKARGEPPAYAVLSHGYVRREVYRTPDLANPYGLKTNWGEKVYLKLDPGTYLVLNVPTGEYMPAADFPTVADLIGIDRILATLPGLVSRKYEGALFPIELANGIASMSNYPSAKILERFLEGSGR